MKASVVAIERCRVIAEPALNWDAGISFGSDAHIAALHC